MFDSAVTVGCIRCRQATGRTGSRRGLLIATGAIAAVGAAGVVTHLLRTTRATAPPTSDILEVTYDYRCRGAVLQPASVPRSTPCPLILLYDPGGDALGIVRRYSDAARQRGWAAASSFEIANGTPDDADTVNTLALFDYVRSRRAIDGDLVFAGGFSGGGCGAYRLAIAKSEIVRGAIVECGHMGPWREVGDMAVPSLRFYLFTRERDFNRPATRRLQAAMQARRCRVIEVERQGGHAPMTPDEVGEALDWLVHV